MSTIAVTSLKHASSSSNNVVLDSGGNVSFTGTAAMASSFLRNRIINGDMRIDQRNAGASFTTGNPAYGIDRWLFQTVGANGSAQRVTGSTGNNTALRITGAASLTTYQVSQRIELVNIFDLASQQVTVSFVLYGSASGSVSIRRVYPTVADNYTATTEPVGGTTVNFTTTATRYTISFTLDSNANKGLWLLFDFGAVGSGVTRTIEEVQIEAGSIATPFERRQFGHELMLCQRYFVDLPAGSNVGMSVFADACLNKYFFPVIMRTTPVLSLVGTSTVTVDFFGIGNSTSTSFTLTATNVAATWDINTLSPARTAGRPTTVQTRTFASAEL
jgi:hypothetical protein